MQIPIGDSPRQVGPAADKGYYTRTARRCQLFFSDFLPPFGPVGFSALPGRHRKDGGTIIFYKKISKNLDR